MKYWSKQNHANSDSAHSKGCITDVAAAISNSRAGVSYCQTASTPVISIYRSQADPRAALGTCEVCAHRPVLQATGGGCCSGGGGGGDCPCSRGIWSSCPPSGRCSTQAGGLSQWLRGCGLTARVCHVAALVLTREQPAGHRARGLARVHWVSSS